MRPFGAQAAQPLEAHACPGRPPIRCAAGDPQGRAFASSLHAMNRVGQSEDLAEVVAFLFSDKASFMTGQDVGIDGGAAAAAVSPAQ